MSKLQKRLTQNSNVRVPAKSNVRVCRNFVVKLSRSSGQNTGTKIRKWVSGLTTATAKRVLSSCLPRAPPPVRVIGQGGFGKVWGLRGGALVMKLQLFAIEQRLDSQSGEMFLGQLFGMNGIGPRNIAAGFVFTDSPGIALSYIVMDRGVALSDVLRKAPAPAKRLIAAKILPQFLNHLNRMLTIGFACVDLKPSNALFDRESGRLSLIDFSLTLCPQVPAIIDKYANRSKGNKIASSLPKRIRRDVIASQLVMFHCTAKLWYKVDVGRRLIDAILKSESILNNVHKICVLGQIPDEYDRLTSNEEVNHDMNSFLFAFARQLSHNFVHYAKLDQAGLSVEVFAQLLGLKVSR